MNCWQGLLQQQLPHSFTPACVWFLPTPLPLQVHSSEVHSKLSQEGGLSFTGDGATKLQEFLMSPISLFSWCGGPPVLWRGQRAHPRAIMPLSSGSEPCYMVVTCQWRPKSKRLCESQTSQSLLWDRVSRPCATLENTKEHEVLPLGFYQQLQANRKVPVRIL